MSRQKKELLLACEERDNHQLDKELLTNRLRHLEGEVEAGKNSLNEKSREIRILEVRTASATVANRFQSHVYQHTYTADRSRRHR